MELEELKKSYKSSEVRYSPKELKSIFEIRTQSTIKSINRKMLLDALLMALMTIILISITFMIGLRSRFIISSQIAGFGLVLFIHYRIKYYLLNNIDFEKNGINSAINRVFNTLRLFWIGYKIVIPALTVYMASRVIEFIPFTNNMNEFLIYPTVGIIMFYVTSYLLKAIYGEEMLKLIKLKNSLSSLKDNL